MDRYPQPSNSHGSLKDIQILVNRFPDLKSFMGTPIEIWEGS